MSRCTSPILATILLLTAIPAAAVAQKIRVENADGLPRHAYSVPESATRLIEDDAQFRALATQLAADLRSDLAKYEITDRATLKGFYRTLSTIALLDGRHDVALAYMDSIRAIEDKPALQAIEGTVERALAAAARAPEADREKAFAAAYRAEIDALPYELVQAELKQRKAMAELRTPEVLMGSVQATLEPAARSGQISRELAQNVVGARRFLRIGWPIHDELAAVLGDVIARHTVVKPDIWAARDVSLEGRTDLTPVVIGIWDTGVDASIFSDRMFVNAKEIPENGKDDDGNGFVDDVHGIAYDLHGNRITGVLHHLSYGPEGEARFRSHLKGFMDLQASVDSRDADELKRVNSQLSRSDYTTFFEGLNEYGNYAHGTHVAGIAVAGNPAARVLVARMTFDYHMIPEIPTLELAQAFAREAGPMAAYFRAAGVRVVNMSWLFAPEYDERALELNNAGGTPEERKALAQKLYDIEATALRAAFEAAPDILFVAAAGNADEDNRFTQTAPASFDLPNLITAAAVDQAGDEAAFTSYGKAEVYANGYEVESFLPGGTRSPLSGTSMAAPQVVNLAAKLLAVHPKLTVAQLRQAILSGAEAKTVKEGKQIMLLNPARSFEIAARLANQAVSTGQ